jgi:hypothetical protein
LFAPNVFPNFFTANFLLLNPQRGALELPKNFLQRLKSAQKLLPTLGLLASALG